MGTSRTDGNRFGTHRVMAPSGGLPQAADRLDPSLPIYRNEMRIRVERLNIDAASFAWFLQETGGDLELLKGRIVSLVKSRGKLHNPVTNSGGCLLGQVAEIGPDFPDLGLDVGDRVATMVSLTLTPLILEEVIEVQPRAHQLSVRGDAILFASGMASRLPSDLPEPIALGVLDVCGAPATMPRVAHDGDIVVVLGAGRAGILTMAAAKEVVGPKGMVIALDRSMEAITALEAFPFVDDGIVADAADPVAVAEKVRVVSDGKMADLAVNCASSPRTEMAAILACRAGGTVVFFNMTTSFQTAVLGAEGLAHDVTLLMGTGYIPGHAPFALDLVRRTAGLLQWLQGGLK